MIEWPPPYVLRKHRLTKRVKLVASKRHGLVVSVPYRYSVRKIPALLEEHKNWIIKHISQLQHAKQALVLPREISLRGGQEKWLISYQAISSKPQIIIRPGQSIVVIGQLPTTEHGFRLLSKWLKAYAQTQLIHELETISNEIQLKYTKVMVRNQVARWGSCNNKKELSLNFKLIFLPPVLLRHIIIHELCHTIHLNHSPAFWALVALFDPYYEAHRKALRQADHYIPPWV